MNDWIDAEQHVERAHEFFEANRLSEAEAELREAIALNPDRAEWHFNLGLTLEAAGRRREAVDAFRRAHALSPDEPQTALLIGVNLLRAADDTGRPPDADAREAVAWLEEARAHESGPRADAAVHLIEAYARVGDHDKAEVSFYLALQEADADRALAYVNIADSLSERGEHARAAAALREAAQLDPAMPGVYARLAGACAAMGRRERARRLYIRELRLNPGDVDTLIDLGALLVEMGRPGEAAEKFRRALEIEPDNADAHYELGVLELDAGRYERARRSLRLVLRLDPTDQRARRRLAEINARTGRPRDARAILVEQAAALTRGGADLPAEDREELGLMLLDADAPAEAARVLSTVLDPPSADARLWRALSVALLRCGQRAAGVRAARRARRIEPGGVADAHNIALALLESGQLRRAGVWIHHALAKAPTDPQLRRLRWRWRWARLGSAVARVTR